MKSNTRKTGNDDLNSRGKRRLLKALSAGGVVATAPLLPTAWTKPVVNVVVLPAHAQMSPASQTISATFTGFITGTPPECRVGAELANVTVTGSPALVDGTNVDLVISNTVIPDPGTTNLNATVAGGQAVFTNVNLCGNAPVRGPGTSTLSFTHNPSGATTALNIAITDQVA